MTSDDDSREHGVEFGPLADDLDGLEYPVEKADLLAAYGDRTLDLVGDQRTLRKILEPLGAETFESSDDVTQTVAGVVGDEAVGRKNYSDRGGPVSGGEDDEGAP
jgi:hypothetical protein